MSKNRMFRGKPVRRLIVSIEQSTIETVDNHLNKGSCWRSGNRSEFVRLAIEEKLKRELVNFEDQTLNSLWFSVAICPGFGLI